MDGGALIGHGTFGCVFDPPLHVLSRTDGKCEKVAMTGRAVGKISESEEVSNEIEAAKALSQIPNHRLYFSVADLSHINRPCPSNQQPDRAAINECPVIQKAPMSHMLHFTMPHSGSGLKKYFTIHVKGAAPMPVERAITHLLEAAAVLALNNYVHYDMHSGNILFDDVTKMPRIIDFGFSFCVTDINKDTLDSRWRIYTPDYPSEAPELTAIQGIRNKLSVDTVIKEIMAGKKPLKSAQFILGMPMAQQERAFRAFWSRSKSIQEADWTTFFKFYWPGLDAWGIGVILLDIYAYIARVPAYTKAAGWKGLSTRILDVIRGLLRMNPVERIDCVEALYIFHPESPILASDTATTWIQEREKMRRPL
jgi:hypothetical protein